MPPNAYADTQVYPAMKWLAFPIEQARLFSAACVVETREERCGLYGSAFFNITTVKNALSALYLLLKKPNSVTTNLQNSAMVR